jgi:hypothetical protein
MQIGPVTLEGQHVRLEPVSLTHVPALWRVGAYEEIWRYIPYTIRSEDDMRSFIEAELRKQQAGLTLGFASIAKLSLSVSTASSARFTLLSRSPSRTVGRSSSSGSGPMPPGVMVGPSHTRHSGGDCATLCGGPAGHRSTLAACPIRPETIPMSSTSG